jgi:hypothetical protein
MGKAEKNNGQGGCDVIGGKTIEFILDFGKILDLKIKEKI